MDTDLWQLPAPIPETPVQEPEQVAQMTRELLSSQGFCYWRCSDLGGEIIKIVRDEPPGKSNYPVYTLAEIERISGMDIKQLQHIYRLKKASGGTVVSVGKEKADGP